ncbi:MAG TPA: phosphotransferase [Burkholderiaceae bacterium]
MNFKVVPVAGATSTPRVLKVTNPQEDMHTTEQQTACMQHVLRTDRGLPLAQVHPALSGAYIVRAALADGRISSLRLLDYLPGQPQHLVPASLAQAKALGTILGRLDLALASFACADRAGDLLWDLQNFAQVTALMPHMEAGFTRATIATVARMAAGLPDLRLPVWRRQLIHNDLNPHNVLMAEDGITVSGILDFGDMVCGPLVADLAVAASYQLGIDAATDRARCNVMVAAYDAAFALLPDEQAALPVLMALRLATTVLVTEWRAKRYPQNRDYILRNNPRARAGLALLANEGLFD